MAVSQKPKLSHVLFQFFKGYFNGSLQQFNNFVSERASFFTYFLIFYSAAKTVPVRSRIGTSLPFSKYSCLLSDKNSSGANGEIFGGSSENVRNVMYCNVM